MDQQFAGARLRAGPSHVVAKAGEQDREQMKNLFYRLRQNTKKQRNKRATAVGLVYASDRCIRERMTSPPKGKIS